MLLFYAFCVGYDVMYLIHSVKKGLVSGAVFAGILAAVSAAFFVISLIYKP